MLWVLQILADAAREVDAQRFSRHFLLTEWEVVVDAWQLDTWEAYRDVRRLGRTTRLPAPPRAVLWSMFDRVRSQLQCQCSRPKANAKRSGPGVRTAPMRV
jgi:hypothetical protein